MGRIIKYAPLKGDVHVNTPLSNVSVAFLQDAENFVAGKVFKNIPSTKQSDRYFVYDRGEFARDQMKLRAMGTESAGGSYDIDNTPNFFCDPYAIHKDVPDQLRGNADDAISLDSEATEWCTEQSLIRKEKIFAAKYFVTGLWGTSQTTSNWGPSGTATDPNTDIRAGKTSILLKTGKRANTLVLGQNVYDALADNADVIERVNAGQTPNGPAVGTINAMRQLWEIDNIYVMAASENTAKEGQDPSYSFIGADNALLCYSAPRPGRMTASAGYTFSWTGYLGAGAEGGRIKSFYMKSLSADRIEMEMAFDMKLIAADLGYFFLTPITSA
jgi:hypothetical protein